MLKAFIACLVSWIKVLAERADGPHNSNVTIVLYGMQTIQVLAVAIDNCRLERPGEAIGCGSPPGLCEARVAW